jgi:hypothetical protein
MTQMNADGKKTKRKGARPPQRGVDLGASRHFLGLLRNRPEDEAADQHLQERAGDHAARRFKC